MPSASAGQTAAWFSGGYDCRKPKPGLLLKAAEDHKINLKNSWMIGDGITDIQAGVNAGCKTIFIGRMKYDLANLIEDTGVKPNFVAPNLYIFVLTF